MKTPRSMTGYGRAEGTWRSGKLSVEIKSLNHRFFEIRVKLPKNLYGIEQQVCDFLRDRMPRGRVEATATLAATAESTVQPVLNEALADKYISIYKTLAAKMGATRDPNPGQIMNMGDVISTQDETADPQSTWEAVRPVFEAALSQLESASEIEGDKLTTDIKRRLKSIEGTVAKIEELAPLELAAYRERLQKRILQLIDKPEIDPNRIAQEIALYAAKCDFTEESVRLKSHIERFNDLLGKSGSIGKTLDFLLQEMLREINTTASKSLSAGISQLTVDVKAELEKIKEQVQNIL